MQVGKGPNFNNISAMGRNKRKHKKKRFNVKRLENIQSRGGTDITNDQFTYFVNILNTIKKGFESVEDKVTMANNVFEETIGEEIHFSSNVFISNILETLIGFVSAEHFERFQENFTENLRTICSHKISSHVLQKIIEIAFLRAIGTGNVNGSEPPSKKVKSNLLSEKEYNITNEFPEQHRQTCSAFVLKTGKFLLNNLEDFIWDPCANHIMRTSILCLSGIHASKFALERENYNLLLSDSYTVPEEWSQIPVEYANRLQLWPHFSDFPYTELSSAFLGIICIALKKIDKNLLKHFGKKILHDSFLKSSEEDDKKKVEIKDNGEENNEEEVKLPKVLQSSSALRLLETLLAAAGRKLFTQLYVMLLSCRIKFLAVNRQTNFVVQRLIENVKEKADFEAIFTEISDNIEQLLRAGHTGVVAALSAACLRLTTKQGAFVTAMQNALHTGNSKEKAQSFFTCLLKLKPYEIAIDDKTQFIHLHGSITLQNILHFNKPIFLVNCILGVPSHDLAAIFSTINGSYIADAFLESKFIGEKSREKLIRYLEGCYVDMAITRCGSRVVEKLFEAASDGEKCRIAKELADKSNQLNGNMFGRILFQKFRLETYQLSPNQWKAAFDKANKAEKLFKDILSK